MSNPASPMPHYCETHNQHYWLEDGCAECYREDSKEPEKMECPNCGQIEFAPIKSDVDYFRCDNCGQEATF